jgi:hypothetical protein
LAGGEQALTLLGLHLEPTSVDLLRGDLEDVSRRTAQEDSRWLAGGSRRLEGAPQVRDVGLQRAHRTWRRSLAPDVVDQAIDRHHAVGAQQEDGQDGALPWPADVRRFPTDQDVERPEDAEFDTVAARRHGWVISSYGSSWSAATNVRGACPGNRTIMPRGKGFGAFSCQVGDVVETPGAH